MARSAYIYVVMDDRVGGEVLAVFTDKRKALEWLEAYKKQTTFNWYYDPVLYRYPDFGSEPGILAELESGHAWSCVVEPTRIEL